MAEPQLGKVEAGDERIDDADKGIRRDVVIHARRQQTCLGAIDSFNEALFQSPSARALPQIVFVASVSPESAPRESQRQWSRLRGPRCGGSGGIDGGGTSALGRTSDRFFSPPEI
jgi:hypothetical protein